MELSTTQYLAVGLIIFGSSVVQGTVGFASGLFGIPLLIMVGLQLQEAIAINLVAAFVQSIIGSYKLRHEIDFPATVRPSLIRFATMPLGVYVLGLTSTLHRSQVKQIIGAVLLVIVVLQWLWRVKPRQKLHWMWEWIAFTINGFVAGFCGMGGPLMALWVIAHDWTSARSRGFMFFMFVVGMPVQGAMYYVRFGGAIVDAALIGLMGILLMFAGTAVGLRVGGSLPKRRLRQLIYVVLVFIAGSAILTPLMPWSQ